MFYERYVKLCMSRKIAPSTAATKAGFNRGTVSVWKKKYDAGLDVVPEQEIINKICDFFGCTEQWLRGIDAGKEKVPTEDGEHKISEEDIKLALFGGDGEVTDAMWDEAQFAIQLIKERYKRKKDANE